MVLLLAAAALLLGSAEGRRRLRPVAVALGWLPPRHETADYRARVGAFERENAMLAPSCSLLVGDSLSEGFPPDLAQRLGLVVRGISGDRVADIERRLEPSVLAAPCRSVLLLAGTNDVVLDRAAPDVTADALLQLADRIAASGRRSTLVGVPPTGRRHAAANPAIRELDARLARGARERGLGWLDLHGALADERGALPEALSPDGIHLARPAYDRFAALLAMGPGSGPPGATPREPP